MFYLSFTTPAKDRSKGNKRQAAPAPPMCQVILTWALLLVWVLLMSFGVITQVDPVWLQELSHPGKRVEAGDYKNFGDDQLRQKNYSAAITNYHRSLEILPDRLSVIINMAIAYRESGDYPGSARTLNEALASAESPILMALINYNLGELYEKQGRLDQARDYYTKALEGNFSQDRICSKLGDIHIAKQEFPQARAAYEQALEYRRNPAREYTEMLQEALDLYEDDPDELQVIEGLLSRGLTEADLEAYDLEYIRQLRRRDPTIASFHDHLGLVCVRLQDINSAITHFEQLLAIYPNNPNTINRLRELKRIQNQQP